MSVSWRLEAECSSFSFLYGDALSVGPAPPWRQAPIRSPVLGPALRAFGTLGPQPECRQTGGWPLDLSPSGAAWAQDDNPRPEVEHLKDLNGRRTNLQFDPFPL